MFKTFSVYISMSTGETKIFEFGKAPEYWEHVDDILTVEVDDKLVGEETLAKLAE